MITSLRGQREFHYLLDNFKPHLCHEGNEFYVEKFTRYDITGYEIGDPQGFYLATGYKKMLTYMTPLVRR